MHARSAYTANMNQAISDYNQSQLPEYQTICMRLADIIAAHSPGTDHKIWHGSPVWFIDGNPIVGYAARKNNVQLLFWSGQSFDEASLQPEGSFKAADRRYTNVDEINEDDVIRWLQKARDIQWDYKNIVKRKGRLERLV